MKDPKTKMAKFLKALIEKKEVSIKTFGESSMRSRISDLRLDYGLNIESRMIEATNEFGNTYRYASYVLLTKKNDALKIYNKINNL